MGNSKIILLVAVAHLCFLLFLASGTNAARFYPTNDETGSIRRLFAGHATESGASDSYYGFIATIDVYGFSLDREQLSLASVWILDRGDGAASSLNAIQIGWEVWPFVYGDSRTRFFTIWTNDGFQKTGCRNMNCTGFQPQSGATIAPGDVIEHVSQSKGTKQNITVKVLKDSASGDWLVHCGLNRDPALIGRFPKSLFTGVLADRATSVRFGAVVTTPTTNLAPMGSGYLPTNAVAAASISNIQFIDQNGQASPVTQDLPTYVTNRDMYDVTPMANGQFFYGGPLQAADGMML